MMPGGLAPFAIKSQDLYLESIIARFQAGKINAPGTGGPDPTGVVATEQPVAVFIPFFADELGRAKFKIDLRLTVRQPGCLVANSHIMRYGTNTYLSNIDRGRRQGILLQIPGVNQYLPLSNQVIIFQKPYTLY